MKSCPFLCKAERRSADAAGPWWLHPLVVLAWAQGSAQLMGLSCVEQSFGGLFPGLQWGASPSCGTVCAPTFLPKSEHPQLKG